MTPDPASALRGALDDLCALAAAAPDDGSDAAGLRVLDVLRGAGARGDDRLCPFGCPVRAWLLAHAGDLRLLVTPLRAVLSGAFDATTGKIRRWVVNLPGPVRAAVRLVGQGRADDLVTEEAA